MKDFFINNYINIITKNKKLSFEELEKYRYGIEGIYLTLTKLIIILILGLFFGIVKEIILLLLFYNLLRFFGFGYHAKGSKQCLSMSIFFFFLLPLLSVKNILVLKYKYLIIFLCIINFVLFAPSDTRKRPMINKKKKILRKSALIAITILYSLMIYKVNNNMSNFILLSIVIESIMVNPLIYIITKEPYNNYKNYLEQV